MKLLVKPLSKLAIRYLHTLMDLQSEHYRLTALYGANYRKSLGHDLTELRLAIIDYKLSLIKTLIGKYL